MTAIRCTRGLAAGSAAVGLWLAAAAAASQSGVWINVSPSLPMGIYRTVGAMGAPGRGRIVLVCLPATIARLARRRGYLGRGPCPGDAGRLGKVVAAVAGDTVDVEARGVTINGRLIEASAPRARDHAGRPLARVGPGAWVVPAGTVFLLATRHPLSFDSRYYGAVPIANVVQTLRPIYSD
jgi:conjugative transfer signal peptidase TraF